MMFLQKIFFFLFLAMPLLLSSQDFKIEGKVVDINNQPISFVNVLLFEDGGTTLFKGTITNDQGFFNLSNLQEKEYIVTISMIGFKSDTRKVNLSEKNKSLGVIQLNEDVESLEETVISVKRPTIKKEAGKLIFTVENTSLSTGNTYSLLSKTPGVLVIGDQISIKNSSTLVFLNGKRVYLSASELSSLLKNMDASVIKSIEVITNPSAKYDAEAESVLNIITSKAISVGYKGSVYGTYEQSVYPKYNFGTSHFYKNDLINLYANYSYSPRKEYKQDDNDITFFKPNGEIKSIWDTDFNRTTKSYAHQGNIIADFDFKNDQSLSLSLNVNISPNKMYNNNVHGDIYNVQHQLDSIFKTKSTLENDTKNFSVNAEHKIKIGDKGTSLTTGVNFINYSNKQDQNVGTHYFDTSGGLLRENNFNTHANQDSDIFTGQMDVITPLLKGDFELGVKYSYIDTKSSLDFFDIENNVSQFNNSLSDSFIYKESIFAGYLNFSKKWNKWNLNSGIRFEYTNIDGDSQSLGVVNTQKYFEPFPTFSLLHTINDKNSIEFAYARRLERPRYQSLNPFKYFINENNYNGGNPNLVPAIDNKFSVSYSYKNKLVFEAYYIDRKNKLSILTFQDNINSTLRNVDVNLISDINYSLDVTYNTSLKDWWYFWAYSSFYYNENKFFALESTQETYSNDTFATYVQLYNGFTLSKDKTLTSDVTFMYISNTIEGSYDYENQYNLSISLRKSFWDKRASVSVGVDDVFNSFYVPISSRYYNQDNSYFPHIESRLFKLNFKYNFGNARLRDNNRSSRIDESDRLD